MKSCKTCKYRNCVAIRCADCVCKQNYVHETYGVTHTFCGCAEVLLCSNYEYVKHYVIVCVNSKGNSYRNGEYTFLWQAKRAAHTIGKNDVGMLQKIYIFDTRTNNRIGVEL